MADIQARRHDELLQRAADSVNRGDILGARHLAELVLADDAANLDASTLVATESQPDGEVRRLTVMFCDLVGSTALSGRLDPELYRSLLTRYRRIATEIVEDRFGGHVASTKGDGMLALFGYPAVHDNDTERAVQAGLDIAAAVQALSESTSRHIGEPLAIRAAVHRGLLYIDPEEDDVYGLAANVAARLQDLARPGTVVVSDAVRLLVGNRYDLQAGEPTLVKGVTEKIQPFEVVARRTERIARPPQAPLIGRTDELEQLRAAWADAMSGQGARAVGVGVIGEAGLGKSRLTDAFIDEARTDGATIVRLAATPEHTTVGLHPLRVLLEKACGITRDTSPPERVRLLAAELAGRGFAVADTVPLLAPVLGLEPEHGFQLAASEGRKLNDEVGKAALEYLLARLGDGHAVLVVEDHHWLDDATVELTDSVLRSGRDGTLVIITSRAPLPRSLSLVELGPLSQDARLALIDALVPPGAKVGDRRALAARSDGVPLFVEELVASLEHAPVAPKDRPARSEMSTVPDVLYEPLVARIHSTPSGAVVASAAATIGREVDVDLLTATVDLPIELIREVVEGLLGALILERVDADEATLRFRHELVREVAYDLQPPSRRRTVHGRIAEVIMRGVTDDDLLDWCVVASHFERADRPEDAIDAYDKASEEARRRGAVNEARLHLGRAVELVATCPNTRAWSQREVELRLRRGYLTMSAEGAASPAAALDYERCLELSLSDAHGAELVSTLTSMWAYYASRADLAQTRIVSNALQDAIGDEWEDWKPSNVAGFGMVDWFEGNFTSSIANLQAGVDALRAKPNLAMEAAASWYVPTHPVVAMAIHLAIAKFMDGDTVGAASEYAIALERAEQLDFPSGPWSWSYSTWLGTWMEIEQRNFDSAARGLEEMARVCERHGYDSFAMIGMTQTAALNALRDVHALNAERSSATQAAMLGALISAWQMVELRCLLPFYLTSIGALVDDAGDRGLARERYDESLALAQLTGQHFYDAETLRRIALQDPDTVVPNLHTALELAREQGAKPFELRIALDLHDRQGETARPILQTAVDGFRADASYVDLDQARARLARR